MPEIPECLNNRYKALDELIKEMSKLNLKRRDDDDNSNTDDPGIKLMCDFWKILKEDPDCNLTQAVKERMGVGTSVYTRQRVTCYVSGTDSRNEDKKAETLKKINSLCCKSPSEDKKHDKCGASKSTTGSDVLPLSKVLCNLKEAASFDKKCNARINELMKTQKELQEQIQHLEHREAEGVQLLKQADCMWSCMEDAYKKKVADSLERQNALLKQLKEVEKSNTKWRKNRKDLESQVDNITKCHREILDKIAQKTNDTKCIDLEIADFNKRIENHKKETEAAKKTLSNKKQATDNKIASIATEVAKLNKKLSEQSTIKYNKEQEGAQYVREAREDLQKICRLLLQKKLENEDLTAEKEALNQEIDLLKQTCAQCQDKCKNKQITIAEEIKKTDKEIADFKAKCIQCHQCTDTVDARKYCNDCPRCVLDRDCIIKEDLGDNKEYCGRDPNMDCVCMTVKRKLLDNVFENMYTVLDRQSKTKSGKAVAGAIVGCLKNSRNGKLDDETRNIVQSFVLDSVKKNLDLTIVGGAVKTRCEMDPETYKQLMLCLKQVKAVKAPKADKGTFAKKEPCGRWGGCSECHCPGGPKKCVCAKKAPPATKDPAPCPHVLENKESGEILACPHKQSKPCGPDCGNREPNLVGFEVSSWKPDPCAEASCPFSKNMRAAQCVLGPEPLCSGSKNHIPVKLIPDSLEDAKPCKCKKSQPKPRTCRGDAKQMKAESTNCNDCTCAATQQLTIYDHQDALKNKERWKELKINLQTIDNNMNSEPIVHDKQNIPRGNDKAIKEKTNVPSKHNEITQVQSSISNTSSRTILIELEDLQIYAKDKKSVHDSVTNTNHEYKEKKPHFLNNCFVKVKIHDDDSQVYEKIDAPVVKTNSGNIAIDLESWNKSKHIRKDRAVYLEILNSGDIILHISFNTDFPNAIMKKSTSGSLLLVITDPDLKLNCSPKTRVASKEIFYKFKIKRADVDFVTEPPAVLKKTRSNNYIVIPDKEYENRYDLVINEIVEKDTKYFACISEPSESDSYVVIQLTEYDKANAYLIKSVSGNIRVIRNISSNESVPSNGKKVSGMFYDAISSVSKMNNEDDDVNKCDNIISNVIKSISDSNVYEKLKSFHSDSSIATESQQFILKKDNSGKYTIILDKESKLSLIKKLQSYLQNNYHAKVPVKKLKNGDILIDLNGDLINSNYGSLRITQSGNIYVNVDEEAAKDRIKKQNENSSIVDKKSKHFIGKLCRPINKGVSTTCNAMPDERICDESKCVCSDILFQKNDWAISSSKRLKSCLQNKSACGVDSNEIKINIDSRYKVDCTESISNYSIKNESKSSSKVENKCSCKQTIERSSEQCYYVIESVCPHNTENRENISNDFEMISGLSEKYNLENGNKSNNNFIDPGQFVNNDNNWDSLGYLTLQLPEFLQHSKLF